MNDFWIDFCRAAYTIGFYELCKWIFNRVWK